MPAMIVDNESPLTPVKSPAMIVDDTEEWARAVRIPYSPTTVGDWGDPAPDNVRDALDDLIANNWGANALVNVVDVQSA